MAADAENISIGTSGNETFYDAIDSPSLVVCESSPKPFSDPDEKETDAKHLNDTDTPVMALNETYALSREASILLCNRLPFLDNAIKSIQIYPYGEVNELTTPKHKHRDLLANTEIGTYQAPAENCHFAKESDKYPIEFHGLLQSKDFENNCEEDEEEIIQFYGEAKEPLVNFESENLEENFFLSNTNIISHLSPEVEKSSEYADPSFSISEDQENTAREYYKPEISSDEEKVKTHMETLIESQGGTNASEASLSIAIEQTVMGEDPLKPTENDVTNPKSAAAQEEESAFSILEDLREKRKPNPPKRILTPEEDAARNKFPRYRISLKILC